MAAEATKGRVLVTHVFSEPGDHKPKNSGCKGWVQLLELETHNPPMLLPSLSLHHLHQHQAKCATENCKVSRNSQVHAHGP